MTCPCGNIFVLDKQAQQAAASDVDDEPFIFGWASKRSILGSKSVRWYSVTSRGIFLLQLQGFTTPVCEISEIIECKQDGNKAFTVKLRSGKTLGFNLQIENSQMWVDAIRAAMAGRQPVHPDGDKEFRLTMYQSFLTGLFAQSQAKLDRDTWVAYRRQHGIGEEEHAEALQRLSMAPAEFRAKLSDGRGGGAAAQGPVEECCVCLDAPANSMLAPCGHHCMCFECAETLRTTGTRASRRCPLCRTELQHVVKVF